MIHWQFHGIVDDGVHALGPRPEAADERRAHQDAERRLGRVQEALRRQAVRAPEISR